MNWVLMQELEAALAEWGQPAYRAKQVREGVLRGLSFDKIPSLPAALRERLAGAFVDQPAVIERVHEGGQNTQKLLFRLGDGERVEGVVMKYRHGNTLCLSTQSGCRMGCVFCASGMFGLARDLTWQEMLGQVIAASAHLRAAGGPLRTLTNLVLMGSGEPLENWTQVHEFLQRVSSPDTFGISPRNISVSTCGLPEGIADLTKSGLPVTLCWSMHAPTDELRKRLMPGAAARATVAQVVAALRHHAQVTRRRVIVEYTLVRGLNDGLEQAKQVVTALRGLMCHVNLIPCNPVPGRPYQPSTRAAAQAFLAELEGAGMSVTLRRTLGDDVAAACGQLVRIIKEE